MSEVSTKGVLRDTIRREVAYLSHHASHPAIHTDIDAVWVFSGPGTFFIPLDPGEPKHFAWMDRYRILYGLAVVRKVAAKRLGKDFTAITSEDILKEGPILIYNGTPKENAALRKELAVIGKSMPPEKVIIIDEVKNAKVKEIKNTLDQIKSFPKSMIGNTIKHRVALISHAAHLSRILRYIEKYQIFPRYVKVELFPIIDSDKEAMSDAEKETNKIWEYFKKGDLSWDPFPAEV